ncbi:FAD-dependent oxidoreductase [Actinomadura sp. DC4]|uniref:NAD(P)/FAD-dependent oxidoreductase n=1 Tax=Actinomadura sp. DC4 TaxID=3055069 RepID=UPI0025B1C7D4|nr:FAD-dependent oxidoreductase [Actinomadura sp. DC4]MDN3352436.1 FAD-dependent oxidoreductase [Actinomadura sp. DC4]
MIVITGGSVAGLATALALARQGRTVLVLERGGPPPEGPPGAVAQRWKRPTVPGWRHAHTLTSLGVSVLRRGAPEVLAAAVEAGGVVLDLVQAMPPYPLGRVAGDDELVSLACRRPTLELVLYRHVRDLPGVEIRHGACVRGLEVEAARVTGVVCEDGTRIPAELVIDATGRRAAGRSWLGAAGIGLPDDLTSPSRLRIFSRFYRRHGRAAALNRGNAAGLLGDHYASVLHPGDDRTFSVALGVLPEDRMMRTLRDPAAFTAAALATPGVADWLAEDVSTPATGIRPITCPPNLLRTLAVSPSPVAGLLPVGDAACVTNPLYGRGVSLALAHAFRLAGLLTAHPEAGPAQSRAAARLARVMFMPWFEAAAEDDAERVARWRAVMAGDPPPPRPGGLTMRTVGAVAGTDAYIWRGLIRVLMGLRTPSEVFGDPAFEDRVRRALGGAPPRPVAPGPTRAELVSTVMAGAGS